MHPTQIQVTDTVTPACAPGIPATGDTAGTADAVRDVLLAAARYLSEHGWNQHEYYADRHIANPAACTVGALSMVCYGYPAEDPANNVSHPGHDAFQTAVQHVRRYLDDTFGDEVGGVYGFNDLPGQSKAEILAMLRDAAAWCDTDGEDDELSSASLQLSGDPWHVPGDPTFGVAVGAALGGAE